jgi:hypothetical protein
MPSKIPPFKIHLTSGSFEIEAERESAEECMKFIRQVKKVGYCEGVALIRSGTTNKVLTKIILEDD